MPEFYFKSLSIALICCIRHVVANRERHHVTSSIVHSAPPADVILPALDAIGGSVVYSHTNVSIGVYFKSIKY